MATQEESPVGDLWSSVAKRLWRDLSSQSHALLFRETVVRESIDHRRRTGPISTAETTDFFQPEVV